MKIKLIHHTHSLVSEKNSRTSDSIFIVKSLINKYVTSKQKIFGCFIDLKKAFDSVWRLGLLYIRYYITKIFIQFCQYRKVVKQGYSLSPNLFNILI